LDDEEWLSLATAALSQHWQKKTSANQKAEWSCPANEEMKLFGLTATNSPTTR